MRAWIVLLALLLAGCSGSSDNAAQAVQGTTQCIHGVVVDAAIVPVPDARIDFVGTNVSILTGDDGRFEQCNLAPGTFQLRINATGYIEQDVLVEVAANATAPVQVDIRLDPIPFFEPFSEVRKWDGRMMCGVRVPQNGILLCQLLADLGLGSDDVTKRFDDLTEPPTFVQVELDWDSTQPLGDSLRLMLTDDHREGTDNYAMSQGPSPIMVHADEDVLRSKHLDTQGIFIRVLTGDYQELGFSVTLEQPFTTFTSIYENYRPPDGWRYTDGGGLHPPP